MNISQLASTSSLFSGASLRLQVTPGLVPTTINVPSPVALNEKNTGRVLSTQEATVENLTPAEKRQLVDLQARDMEVREHEQAHKRVGGPYIRGSQFQYTVGPDRKTYAVNGEVSIDAAPVPDDPEETIDKMQVVRRAALAPREPSPKDHSVANKATEIEHRSRLELAQGGGGAAETPPADAGQEARDVAAAFQFQSPASFAAQPGSLVNVTG